MFKNATAEINKVAKMKIARSTYLSKSNEPSAIPIKKNNPLFPHGPHVRCKLTPIIRGMAMLAKARIKYGMGINVIASKTIYKRMNAMRSEEPIINTMPNKQLTLKRLRMKFSRHSGKLNEL
jgi:hypothetical protein